MTKVLAYPDYPAFFAALKDRVLHARISAVRNINRELVLLYWDIGRGIAEKQRIAGWGDAVVERLASDLRAEFPDMHGFSVVNLWRMKQLYLQHTSPEFLSQAVRELKVGNTNSEKPSQAVRELVASIPWGHHANLLAKLTDPAARLYYLRATAQFGWSRVSAQSNQSRSLRAGGEGKEIAQLSPRPARTSRGAG